MRPWRAALLSAGVAVILVGTGSSIAQETVLSERYSGTIPCADCSGIKTILVLNRSSQGAPTHYTMTETFVGKPVKPRVSTGNWTIEHGDAADKNATVYQLHQAGSTPVTSLVKVDGELRLLGGDMTELPASVPHTLKLSVADRVVFKVNDQAGGAVSLKVGWELEVQLPANHTTGYSWVLMPVDNPAVKSQGEATYRENTTAGKVGVGGVEIWRFSTIKAGEEDLKFEYRRPWEKETPAAKTMTIQVTVQ